ncbi:MAG: fasciclin domain-containing protein [Alteraurantiacibacter sp.]
MMHRKLALALALPTLLLAGCNGDAPAVDETQMELDSTVATLLNGQDELSTTAGMIAEAGLAPVLDAAPSYTLLAPTDTGFTAFDTAAEDEASGPDRTAVMAALMRGHLLPGYVTLADIEQALDASDNSSVTMQTMAETPLTFTREGDAVKVTAADGASALLAGGDVSGGNGVILPIDGVLKTL